MKNQYSFRLTTTLLPTDTTAKVTQVINKVDAQGNKFYPTFTEETVVITNDDRTIMETTRAVCTDGAITFTKRWLPDDGSLEPIDNRKLTRNPWSLLFITVWASDIIDRDDDMSWQWDQTYLWKATYKWRLITEKWVEYPHFDTLADLQDYWTPFGWMFAVVDASWELYRYNDVTESWDVITTNEPTNPEQADEVAIGTVRVATDAEFEAGTEQWSNNEYLMATIPQIQAMTPDVDTKVFELNWESDTTHPQQILDYALWGWCPIIRYKADGSSNLEHYYYCTKTASYIQFFNLMYALGQDSTWKFLWQERVRINYSWTTVTDYSVSTTRKIYFNYTD